MPNYTPWLFVFFSATAYAAWFWRSPRAPLPWVIYVASLLLLYWGWWWMIRKSGLSLTKATTLYDVTVMCTWLLPLIIWRERSVSSLQVGGVLLVLAGSLLVALASPGEP